MINDENNAQDVSSENNTNSFDLGAIEPDNVNDSGIDVNAGEVKPVEAAVSNEAEAAVTANTEEAPKVIPMADLVAESTETNNIETPAEVPSGEVAESPAAVEGNESGGIELDVANLDVPDLGNTAAEPAEVQPAEVEQPVEAVQAPEVPEANNVAEESAGVENEVVAATPEVAAQPEAVAEVPAENVVSEMPVEVPVEAPVEAPVSEEAPVAEAVPENLTENVATEEVANDGSQVQPLVPHENAEGAEDGKKDESFAMEDQVGSPVGMGELEHAALTPAGKGDAMKWVWRIGAIVLLLVILYVGYRYLFGGDEDNDVVVDDNVVSEESVEVEEEVSNPPSLNLSINSESDVESEAEVEEETDVSEGVRR